jgi:hypothetical protein
MKSRLISTVFLNLVLGFLTAGSAFAQNGQGALVNEASQIQSEYGTGMINAGQAGQLQQREQQIVNQQQSWMAQNGGKLTPQEDRQIHSEVRGLNRHLQKDTYRNNPGLANYYNGWRPQVGGNYPYSGQYPPQNYPYNGNSLAQYQQWQQFLQTHPGYNPQNVYAGQYNPQNGPYNPYYAQQSQGQKLFNLLHRFQGN